MGLDRQRHRARLAGTQIANGGVPASTDVAGENCAGSLHAYTLLASPAAPEGHRDTILLIDRITWRHAATTHPVRAREKPTPSLLLTGWQTWSADALAAYPNATSF